jgi:hypothetical protein
MHIQRGDWRVCLYLDRHTNPVSVALSKDDGSGLRTIVEWFPGPFDPAEELLLLALEMIENFEWKGVQSPLPFSPGEQ